MPSLHRLACLAAAGWIAAPAAFAQSALHDPLRAVEAMQRADAVRRWEPPPAAFSIVDLGATAPNQRPRPALRMRFDSATRAMRSLGVQADDCSSLIRSSTRMRADQPGANERLQLSVSFAVSCRFF